MDINTTDGLILHGWQFPVGPEVEKSSRRLVLYFPGNAGCRRDRCADCTDFTRLGCEVWLFDYRGYGDNPGSPSEANFAADARAIWSLATTDHGYAPNEIAIFGESLGGAVATRLAAECAEAGEPPAALILNSTFASLSETVAWHHPAFPFRSLLWDKFPSVERIPKVHCPVLQFHGTADDIVPIAHGRRLFAAAPPTGPTGALSRFVAVEGGQHNFITMSDMRTAVGELFEQLRELSRAAGEAAGVSSEAVIEQ